MIPFSAIDAFSSDHRMIGLYDDVRCRADAIHQVPRHRLLESSLDGKDDNLTRVPGEKERRLCRGIAAAKHVDILPRTNGSLGGHRPVVDPGANQRCAARRLQPAER